MKFLALAAFVAAATAAAIPDGWENYCSASTVYVTSTDYKTSTYTDYKTATSTTTAYSTKTEYDTKYKTEYATAYKTEYATAYKTVTSYVTPTPSTSYVTKYSTEYATVTAPCSSSSSYGGWNNWGQ